MNLLVVLIGGLVLVLAAAVAAGFWAGATWTRDRAARAEADNLEESLAWQAEVRSLPPGPLRPFPGEPDAWKRAGTMTLHPDDDWSVPLEFPPAFQGASDTGQMRPVHETGLFLSSTIWAETVGAYELTWRGDDWTGRPYDPEDPGPEPAETTGAREFGAQLAAQIAEADQFRARMAGDMDRWLAEHGIEP